ncbi:MAG: hypothetical protein IPN24_18360 [Betaproteobacteria bacterium]|nr:hypothetical protein [Betaproteobacteria bacterium]
MTAATARRCRYCNARARYLLAVLQMGLLDVERVVAGLLRELSRESTRRRSSAHS